jgi:hypothetical protein
MQHQSNNVTTLFWVYWGDMVHVIKRGDGMETSERNRTTAPHSIEKVGTKRVMHSNRDALQELLDPLGTSPRKWRNEATDDQSTN